MPLSTLVLVSSQGCHEVFQELYDKVEFISAKTEFNENTTILFEGGTDVNPLLYGERRNRYTGRPDLERDAFEKSIFEQAKRKGASFIGICRGAQFLTVLSGGKLIQDVSGHAKEHEIETIGGKRIWVTSTHHQMCYPEGSLKDDAFVIIGWSRKPQSRYYLGEDERPVRVPPLVEPEIIWYPKTRSLAIQGHPEYLEGKAVFPTFCRELVGTLIFHKLEKE